MTQKYIILLIFALSSCSFFKKNDGPPPLPDNLEGAVHSDFRSKENSERDEFQHPGETLAFFGIKPNMTVMEISPGAGFYTEILAPYLAKEGQYVMAVPRMPSNPSQVLIEHEKKLQDILISHPEIQSKTRFVAFEPLNKRNLVKAGFTDMVLSFNSVHNWVATNSTKMAFKFFYTVLKPGGTLGIVQHLAPGNKKLAMKSGYMTENEVIAHAKRAGFKLVEKSSINFNPRDSGNYSGGVWVLPPVYRMGEKDHDKYEEIGESNRMTLKFKK
jgi:predicted methyltransferase